MRAMPLIIALIAGLVGARERAFRARTGYRWLVLHGPSVWVGIELIRGVIPVLGTWGFAAYALYGQPWLIQPVSIVGVYGLSLLILLVNYALALAALALFDRFRRLEGVPPVEASLTRKWLIGVAIMLLAWTGVSQIALHVLPHTLSIRVAAIQPAFRVRTDEGLRRLSDLTRQAAEQGAELIVWHEGALPFDPQVRHADTLQALAAETGAHLVIGYAVETEAGYRNEAVILTRDGAFLPGTLRQGPPRGLVRRDQRHARALCRIQDGFGHAWDDELLRPGLYRHGASDEACWGATDRRAVLRLAGHRRQALYPSDLPRRGEPRSSRQGGRGVRFVRFGRHRAGWAHPGARGDARRGARGPGDRGALGGEECPGDVAGRWPGLAGVGGDVCLSGVGRDHGAAGAPASFHHKTKKHKTKKTCGRKSRCIFAP